MPDPGVLIRFPQEFTVDSTGGTKESRIFSELLQMFLMEQVILESGKNRYKGWLRRLKYEGKFIWFIATTNYSFFLDSFSAEDVVSIRFENKALTVRTKSYVETK